MTEQYPEGTVPGMITDELGGSGVKAGSTVYRVIDEYQVWQRFAGKWATY
jgi:hypothetical protein